jgi:ubiquinone/menaquinone biosynthesis C-methylase UbiE
MTSIDARFTGSIPALYERHLVPAIFDPYAEDLAARLDLGEGAEILEVACGTGALTRRLLAALPTGARLVASDLNEAMFGVAVTSIANDDRVSWKVADGSALPFEASRFDAVVCQFGWMFFTDKSAAARESRRVLRPGGRLVFNVWDAFAHNPFGRIAHETITSYFDADPPLFYKTPFGFHDAAEIQRLLESASFRSIQIETVSKQVTSPSARSLATGLVRGNPVAIAIAERGRASLDEVEKALADALGREGGEAPFSSPMRALVASAVA